MENQLQQLLAEEAELQFTSFNEDTAWEIGTLLMKHAIADSLPVTIDITRFEHQLFHASRPGTSADNDDWVRRKIRVVNRFGHSSFYMSRLLKSKGVSIEKAYLLPEHEYAPHGGCFPILVKGTGMIGTITVSGLPQEEDHALVVKTIREFLAKEK
ncbi:MAG: heme-degrading domain-containing protein [Spirochaetales bacterium]|nr:heme-degrading domain-containing protein [Spirochaetales bacterium]